MDLYITIIYGFSYIAFFESYRILGNGAKSFIPENAMIASEILDFAAPIRKLDSLTVP